MPEDWQAGGFGLYIHWPFCQSKCPYCDFNSHVAARVDQAAWGEALVSELRRYAALLPGRTLNSIFFGGGTPSLMDPQVVAALIDAARAGWPTANTLEVTLEANPTSVEAGRFRGYREAGVNRISMGIQALNDRDLKALGRLHSVEEALRAHDVARGIFDRVSFDLIYARQGQSMEDWRAELTRALDLSPDHLSLYQLTIEPGTAFGDRHARGLLKGLPDEDLGADLYDVTQELCAAAGLPAYEVSNHARPGAESLHNLVYWHYGDYVGIGPGAHGRITLDGQRWATSTERQPGNWLHGTRAGTPAETREPLLPADQAVEYLMMGLRLAEGVSISRFHRLGETPLDPVVLERLTADGLIAIEGDTLSTTPKGRPLLNAILRELLTA
ncbi:radical SAM family heme chaperone HemW [Oceaniglobus roseus]|uniref:radical SAM family heme chaperone HemW n=1 Tax=Oceaniglobus roseus TaxID=1737570 RepID=UPI000C7E9BDC|nr:radical SAM family heme chaperone HemW [Kandeliimicrobium roseum]